MSIPCRRRKHAKVLACPFPSAKKLSKRKTDSISFDTGRTDVLAASDRGSYFEKKKYCYRRGRALMGEQDR